MTRKPRQADDLVIASNRLPISLSVADGVYTSERTSGGLVSALRGVHGPHKWVGWPGTVVPEENQAEVNASLEADGLFPVFLSAEEQEDFYGRICNASIWPLFHYLPDRFSFAQSAWEHYVEVNERFVDTIVEQCPLGARVWVHDFHLMLVPAALRRRRPDLSIGFFLHIPFPSSELYRILPVREDVLRGLLGADYIAFHTGDYARHFRSSCLRVLGLDSEPDVIEYEGRLVGVGVDPIGIDISAFKATLDDPDTARDYAELDKLYAGQRLVLGVDRLDYTKGIPQKLRAFERFLEQDPERAKTTTLLQVLIPSRLEGAEYRAQRDEIELLVAHVNGRFGQPGRTPVEYFHRSLSQSELAALYRRADVLAVTPLRDGMNLVAQEFVLCQTAAPDLVGRWRGALVLSELAGSAHVLSGALLVNPWDVMDITARLVEALDFDPAERRRRLELMAGRVNELDCRRWSDRFLSRLARYARRRPEKPKIQSLDSAAHERVVQRAVRARRRTLLLDYDGTLRELASHPDLAAPTSEILAVLEALCDLPGTEVHIVSGRTRDKLESWLGALPVYLCAEHGYFARAPGGDWRTLFDVDLSWMPRVERLLRTVAADVPGTLVESKACSVAWHYRQAEPEYGAWRAREVMVAIEQLLPGVPAEILRGHRVVEVRARGVNKGAYVSELFPNAKPDSHFVLAAGDDRTDFDLFDALPPGSVAVHVGRRWKRARDVSLRHQFEVDSPGSVRDLLREIVVAVADEELSRATPGEDVTAVVPSDSKRKTRAADPPR
jgi:trehalose 6-phosphate synthase/phosphatase